MEKRHDNDPFFSHPIQQTIPVDKQLSKRLVTYFWHDPASVRQCGETVSDFERPV